MGLLDTLTAGVGKLGQAAGKAIDETRLQMEIMRARRRKDNAARDLGYLVFRVSQGALVSPGEQDALLKRIADAEKEVERLEAEVRKVRQAGKAAPPANEPPKSEPPGPAPPTGGSAGGAPPGGAGSPAGGGAPPEQTPGAASAEPAAPGADSATP